MVYFSIRDADALSISLSKQERKKSRREATRSRSKEQIPRSVPSTMPIFSGYEAQYDLENESIQSPDECVEFSANMLNGIVAQIFPHHEESSNLI